MSLAREKYLKLCSSIEKEMTSKVTQTMYMYTVLSKYMQNVQVLTKKGQKNWNITPLRAKHYKLHIIQVFSILIYKYFRRIVVKRYKFVCFQSDCGGVPRKAECI